MKLKRSFKGLVLLVLSVSLVLAGCGSNNESNNSPAATPAPVSSNNNDSSSEATEKIDITAKYDPPIEITAWRYTESTYQYENGDTIEDNIYTRAYESDLGIKLKYDWTVPVEQFKQKMNVSIASGDLPDIMWVEAQQLAELAENDLIYDLTELYDLYASDVSKSILEQDIKAFNTAKIGDRLMAIPHTSSAVDNLPVLHIRTDWLANLGLSAPTTMQELMDVARAFTNNDPDKNGKNDTFGIAFTKSFLTDLHFGLTGYMSGFHAYPTRWIDKDGQLVYGSIQPEVKDALAVLQEFYKEGVMDKEFGVKDRAKVTESVVAGNVGMFFGSMSAPLSIIDSNVQNDPNADWQSFVIPSIDSNPATPIAKMPVSKYYVVSKEAKNPEAIFKLLNFSMAGYDPNQPQDANSGFGYSETGIATFLYNFIAADPALKNLNAHNNVLKAIETGDSSKLTAEELGYHDKVVAYRNGDRTQWGQERVFGSPSTFDVIGKYVADGNYMLDGFYGAATPTMVERSATLQTMESEVFTNIVMGASLDTFDKFVEDWNNLGGADITSEVNEWYAKIK